jgi:hypothetical protein
MHPPIRHRNAPPDLQLLINRVVVDILIKVNALLLDKLVVLEKLPKQQRLERIHAGTGTGATSSSACCCVYISAPATGWCRCTACSAAGGVRGCGISHCSAAAAACSLRRYGRTGRDREGCTHAEGLQEREKEDDVGMRQKGGCEGHWTETIVPRLPDTQGIKAEITKQQPEVMLVILAQDFDVPSSGAGQYRCAAVSGCPSLYQSPAFAPSHPSAAEVWQATRIISRNLWLMHRRLGAGTRSARLGGCYSHGRWLVSS